MRLKRTLSIREILDRLISQKRWRTGLLAASVRLRWEEIVGPEIAGRAQPLGLTRGRLLVHCDHDVWRTELQYLKPELLKRIAEVVGDGVVKDIFLK
jgi:predicted nucleic acid-binding Zn ribbon protein